MIVTFETQIQVKEPLSLLRSPLLSDASQQRKIHNGLDMSNLFIPWLLEASEEKWVGEKLLRDPLGDNKFLYHLVGIQNECLPEDNYAVILSVEAHHENIYKYEKFLPLFRTFAWATERNMHDCCAFARVVENGKASMWYVNGVDYQIKMGAEEHSKLLAHVLTIMMNKSEMMDKSESLKSCMLNSKPSK